MLHWIRKHLKWVVVGVIPAVMMLFFNSSSNWHYHILPDGTLAIHAHPFSHAAKQTPFSKHTHDGGDYCKLTILSNGLVGAEVLDATSQFIPDNTRYLYGVIVCELLITNATQAQSRAPPVI